MRIADVQIKTFASARRFHHATAIELNTVNAQTKKHLMSSSSACFETTAFKLFGRREWTRTIDPHHVKVVL
jgi:hypothetical protein